MADKVSWRERTEKFVRVNISVPRTLKTRMSGYASGEINWSAVACEAFAKVLDSAAPEPERVEPAGCTP